MARNCNAVTAKKKLPSLLSSQQHFPGIFASEPMTLPEIDHVSFLVEHARHFSPVKVRAQNKVISALFRRRTKPDFSFVCGAGCGFPGQYFRFQSPGFTFSQAKTSRIPFQKQVVTHTLYKRVRRCVIIYKVTVLNYLLWKGCNPTMYLPLPLLENISSISPTFC